MLKGFFAYLILTFLFSIPLLPIFHGFPPAIIVMGTLGAPLTLWIVHKMQKRDQ